jgi:hypothetical protein
MLESGARVMYVGVHVALAERVCDSQTEAEDAVAKKSDRLFTIQVTSRIQRVMHQQHRVRLVYPSGLIRCVTIRTFTRYAAGDRNCA